MKILFVSHGFPPKQVAGTEQHVYHLCRAFQDGRVRCDLEPVRPVVVVPVTEPSRPPFLWDRREVDGIPIVELRVARDRPDYLGMYRNARVDEAFGRILDEERPDVVHVHHLLDLSLGCLEASLRRAIPTVLTLHDYWLVCPLGQRLMRDLYLCREIDRSRCVRCQRPSRKGLLSSSSWLSHPLRSLRALLMSGAAAPDLALFQDHDRDLKALLSRLDLLVTPSRFHAEELERYGLPRERLRVVENGLPAEPFRGLERSSSDRIRFGYVGSVIPSKGVHVLIEAFVRLGRGDVSLDVHGEAPAYHGDTTYLERLERLSRGPNPVRFHGRFQSGDLPRILSGLDALVVPSIWFESFCLTAREAFLAGVPVIASRIGALLEAFREGEGGLFFDVGDAKSLRDSLDRFASDAGLRERLRRSVPAVRTTEDAARELLSLYVSMSSSSK